ncbi:hypothetical protein [Pseudorhodoferax sp. Leaf267]|uniref:hypothetical protein n=1 Tax=Pseudorhodoferax sp. Leaf267 TaxID=1736316 RepID=UPI0006F5E536|nr:hypothetical protein [Pseudorhodoferax sp. Leaf267]KQP11862.1 hypothetical protein ASF43_23195 [Pseudorhodoferax sp. Leaf267]
MQTFAWQAPAQATATLPTPTSTATSHRQAHVIRRLREALFELQCAPEPDPDAIDSLMRRLARVRARCARDHARD